MMTLPGDAVRIPYVADVNHEVVEEVGRPQPLEVAQNDLFGRVVVRNPLVDDGGSAGPPSGCNTGRYSAR